MDSHLDLSSLTALIFHSWNPSQYLGKEIRLLATLFD